MHPADDRIDLLSAGLEAATTDAAERWEEQRASLIRALADLSGRQSRLVRTLEERDDPDGSVLDLASRRLGELDADRSERAARLAELEANPP